MEIFALLIIPFALTYAYGRLVGDQKQGWVIFAAMFFAVDLGRRPRHVVGDRSAIRT